MLGNISGSLGVISPPYLLFLATNREGVLKINEIAPGVVQTALQPTGDPNDHGSQNSSGSLSRPPPASLSIRAFFWRAFELLSNTRGVGWKFGTGTGVYVAKDTRDLSNRSTFLRQTLRQIVQHALIIDVINSVLAHSDLRRPSGTVFGRGRNPVESLIISTFLSLSTGTLLLYGGRSLWILNICLC